MNAYSVVRTMLDNIAHSPLSFTARTHLREARHIRGIYYWLRDGTTFDDLPVAYASSV